MIRIITTFFGAGLLPKAPGTWGSLAALPLGWVLHGLGGPPMLMGAIIIVFFIGLLATHIETRGSEDHDPSSIVIDEVVGMWLALLPLSVGMWMAQEPPWVFPYPGWITAFIAFRFFDIWKPWPVSWADNMHTPLGVMLDDVLAGMLAGGAVIVLAGFYHTAFG